MMITEGFQDLRIDMTEHDPYLWFRFLGPYRFEDFHLAVAVMREHCLQRGRMKAVIDLRATEGDMPNADRFALGVRLAEVWGSAIKGAGLAPASKINKFLENTAVNRQARLQVFADPDPALQWLLEP